MAIKMIPSNFHKSGKFTLFCSVIILLYILGAAESSGLFQKRYPGSVREIYCRFSRTNKIESCQHGSYIDECKRESCYKGVGETCSSRFDSNTQFGLCAAGLECVCGQCSGCSKNQCRLELEFCENRNAIIYDNDNAANAIKSLYDIDSTYLK